MEILKTDPGAKKLCYEGFMYTCRAKSKNTLNWICVMRGYHCKGSCRTDHEYKNPVLIGSHNHLADYNAIEIARQNLLVKEKALSTEKTAQNFFAEAAENLTEKTMDLLNSEEQLSV